MGIFLASLAFRPLPPPSLQSAKERLRTVLKEMKKYYDKVETFIYHTFKKLLWHLHLVVLCMAADAGNNREFRILIKEIEI